MKWIGPFKVDAILNNVIDDAVIMPPEAHSVYLVSLNQWNETPNKDCNPLYIGSNTGKSKRFRTRIGDLIADIFGFYGSSTGHHSGGQYLNIYCKEKKLNPKKLFIGWLDYSECQRCDENLLYWQLKPLLNKSKPPKCKIHIV